MKSALPPRPMASPSPSRCTICPISPPCLRTDIKRGHFDNVAEHLKTLHDGVRGLRTELDLRNDSTWGKQLTSIRAEISNALQSEIDSVPGRVRRLLRQRADKDISAGAKVDCRRSR